MSASRCRKIKMSFQNLLLILCSALSCSTCAAAVIQVFGYEGRGVNISCPYDQGYEDNDKYFCKCNTWLSCDDLIKVSQKNTNKYFIHDDKKLRILNVSISNIRLDDAGTYWCGVDIRLRDIYTEVKLGVKKDSCCDKATKDKGAEEGSVSIICPYESKYQNNLKYMCRGNQRSTCLQQALITSNTRHNGRVTLNDDKKSNTFTVTILNLTLEDSGSYLCGVQRETGLDDFSAAELEVKELCKVKFYISGIVGQPVTFQCSSPQHRDTKKFLCKGDRPNNCADMMTNQTKFSPHDSSSHCFSVTITELEAGDAGTYYCGPDSQLRLEHYTKIHLAVVSLHQNSTVSPITSEDVTSLSPHQTDVNPFYIRLTVLAVLLILAAVILIVVNWKSKKLKGGVGLKESNTSFPGEEMQMNRFVENPEASAHLRSSGYNHEAAEHQEQVNQRLTPSEDTYSVCQKLQK